MALGFDPNFQDTLCALARAAGAAILAVRREGFVPAAKHDDSPVTAADHRAQEIIAAGLQQFLPETPIIAEESALPPWEQRRQWRSCWLVDPLDGTREFVAGSPDFTVNIALVRDGIPQLGVILQPATGDLFAAFRTDEGEAKWIGFHELSRGERTPLAAADRHCPPSDRPLKVVVSRHYGTSEASGVMALLNARYGRVQVREVGSARKFCLLAGGDGDLYPRLAPTCEWDTAAGQAILAAVGGGIFDLAGNPLRYNCSPSLTNPGFIALAHPRSCWNFLFAQEQP